MNKIIIAFFLLALLVQPLAAGTRADSIRAKFLDPDDREVLVAAHRGDWRNYAENSLEGIENAVRMGAER